MIELLLNTIGGSLKYCSLAQQGIIVWFVATWNFLHCPYTFLPGLLSSFPGIRNRPSNILNFALYCIAGKFLNGGNFRIILTGAMFAKIRTFKNSILAHMSKVTQV